MSWDSSFKILQHRKFEKFVKKNLTGELKKALDKKLQYLAENPNHPSLNTKQYKVSSQFLKQREIDEVDEFYINMGFRCIVYVRKKEKTIILAYVGSHEQVKAKYG